MAGETNMERPLQLALIGMSGAGKTFWTKKLAVSGYDTISCDDRIEQKLAPRLAGDGYAGINGVAAWMGWPDSERYSGRESEYLAEEINALDEILTGRFRRRAAALDRKIFERSEARVVARSISAEAG